MRIAYLVNRYPAVSHSFIRREIAALERRGVEVRRYSIRKPDGPLPDAGDQHEQASTRVILARPLLELLASACLEALVRPLKFAACLVAVPGMTPPGNHRLVRAIAYLVEACWLARSLRRDGVEHLHAHFGTNSTTVARVAARLAGLPYSFTAHGPEEFDAAQALGLAAKANAAAFVVAISSFGRSQLLRLLEPDSWSKVHVVRCGLEFGPEIADDVVDDAPRYDFCFVGRLAPQKGLPTLAEALAILVADGRPCTLAMIGGGELEDWFRRFLAAGTLAADVSLLGARSEREVFATMRSSKVVIVPSYAEGLPVVLMEAFANRRPVVTTYVGGIPELVTRETGLLVPAGDAEALAAALDEARSWSTEQRERMGEAGYGRVRRLHDIDKSAGQLHALLASTLAERGGVGQG